MLSRRIGVWTLMSKSSVIASGTSRRRGRGPGRRDCRACSDCRTSSSTRWRRTAPSSTPRRAAPGELGQTAPWWSVRLQHQAQVASSEDGRVIRSARHSSRANGPRPPAPRPDALNPTTPATPHVRCRRPRRRRRRHSRGGTGGLVRTIEPLPRGGRYLC
jgi:hypothetical protein